MRIADTIITTRKEGLYCPAGDFYIDPWRPVHKAVISHAHSDHLRYGSSAYLTSSAGVPIAKERIQKDANIEGLAWGKKLKISDVTLSFHPAGHLLGSSQIRIEHRGKVLVFSGDYKRTPDHSCEAFEVVPCHSFITESTFGLPIYQWPNPQDTFNQINQWWATNASEGKTSVIFAYALGKAQRVLSGLDKSIGSIGVHGAVMKFLPHYERAGFLDTANIVSANRDQLEHIKGHGMIITPMSAQNTSWLKTFAPYSLAAASGWMMLRGTRRRKALDRGFVMSDHVDWNELITTIQETGANEIGVTHGYTEVVARYLREQGKDAFVLNTSFEGEKLEQKKEDDG